MEVKMETDGGALSVYLCGEIDHHSAGNIRELIDGEIERCRPESLVLDFGEVTFMDSSGIGLVMGRYKVIKEIGGRVTLRNTPAHIKKVMRLAGIDKLAVIS